MNCICNVAVTMINSRLAYASLVLIDTHGREDINLNEMISNLICDDQGSNGSADEESSEKNYQGVVHDQDVQYVFDIGMYIHKM